jgi:hypothetical protein
LPKVCEIGDVGDRFIECDKITNPKRSPVIEKNEAKEGDSSEENECCHVFAHPNEMTLEKVFNRSGTLALPS